MLVWLLAASIFSAVYRPARQGQKVAYLTVVSFIFLAFALGALLVGGSEHGKSRTDQAWKQSRSVPFISANDLAEVAS